MARRVAGCAERHVLDTVVSVHVDGVGQDVGFVPVQLPQAEDDVAELYDVVAFQPVRASASEAGGGFVSPHPVAVRDCGADAVFER